MEVEGTYRRRHRQLAMVSKFGGVWRHEYSANTCGRWWKYTEISKVAGGVIRWMKLVNDTACRTAIRSVGNG